MNETVVYITMGRRRGVMNKCELECEGMGLLLRADPSKLMPCLGLRSAEASRYASLSSLQVFRCFLGDAASFYSAVLVPQHN